MEIWLTLFPILFTSTSVYGQNCADPFITAGMNKERAGKFAAAIMGRFWIIIRLFNMNMEQAYWLRGVLRNSLRDNYGALQDCDTAIMLNPRDPNPYCSRGYIKNQLSDFDAGIGDFSIAIRLNKYNAMAYCGRGMTY